MSDFLVGPLSSILYSLVLETELPELASSGAPSTRELPSASYVASASSATRGNVVFLEGAVRSGKSYWLEALMALTRMLVADCSSARIRGQAYQGGPQHDIDRIHVHGTSSATTDFPLHSPPEAGGGDAVSTSSSSADAATSDETLTSICAIKSAPVVSNPETLSSSMKVDSAVASGGHSKPLWKLGCGDAAAAAASTDVGSTPSHDALLSAASSVSHLPSASSEFSFCLNGTSVVFPEGSSLVDSVGLQRRTPNDSVALQHSPPTPAADSGGASVENSDSLRLFPSNHANSNSFLWIHCSSHAEPTSAVSFSRAIDGYADLATVDKIVRHSRGLGKPLIISIDDMDAATSSSDDGDAAGSRSTMGGAEPRRPVQLLSRSHALACCIRVWSCGACRCMSPFISAAVEDSSASSDQRIGEGQRGTEETVDRGTAGTAHNPHTQLTMEKGNIAEQRLPVNSATPSPTLQRRLLVPPRIVILISCTRLGAIREPAFYSLRMQSRNTTRFPGGYSVHAERVLSTFSSMLTVNIACGGYSSNSNTDSSGNSSSSSSSNTISGSNSSSNNSGSSRRYQSAEMDLLKATPPDATTINGRHGIWEKRCKSCLSNLFTRTGILLDSIERRYAINAAVESTDSGSGTLRILGPLNPSLRPAINTLRPPSSALPPSSVFLADVFIIDAYEGGDKGAGEVSAAELKAEGAAVLLPTSSELLSSAPGQASSDLPILQWPPELVGFASLKRALTQRVILPLNAVMYAGIPQQRLEHAYRQDSDGGVTPSSLPSSSRRRAFSEMLHRLQAAMLRMRVKPPMGILLYGSTGCGKTRFAEAIAYAARMRLIVVQCPRLLSKYFGDSEANIRAVFQAARHAAPCVLVLDEIDCIASVRAGGGGGEGGEEGVGVRVGEGGGGLSRVTDEGDAEDGSENEGSTDSTDSGVESAPFRANNTIAPATAAGREGSNSCSSAQSSNSSSSSGGVPTSAPTPLAKRRPPSSAASSSPRSTDKTVSVQDRMLATLLNELDGVGLKAGPSSSSASSLSSSSPPTAVSSAPCVLVIGTTSRKESLDAALLRAGRLEAHFQVPLPLPQDRRAIAEHLIESAASGSGGGGAQSVSCSQALLDTMVDKTSNFTAADVRGLVQGALIRAFQATNPQRSSQTEEDQATTAEPVELLSSHLWPARAHGVSR